MDKEELQRILANHIHWLNEDVDNWENMKANLRNADLRNANLYDTNLRNADLYGTNLYGTNLRNADLYGADLRNANLYGTNLRNADLYGANLYGTDLCNADLRNANLRNADLYGTNLRNADLRNADLRSANLYGADLSGADLYAANLRGAKHIPYLPMTCPEEGEFIGWKKAGKNEDKIVKLFIPDDAKRSSSTTRKCRCSKAKVLEIYNLDGTIAEEREIESNRDETFIYTVGETVEVPDFDDSRWEECSTGIHFFINRQEAINYEL